jgi:hypothetical protein
MACTIARRDSPFNTAAAALCAGRARARARVLPTRGGAGQAQQAVRRWRGPPPPARLRPSARAHRG